jgi:hypothetical protein
MSAVFEVPLIAMPPLVLPEPDWHSKDVKGANAMTAWVEERLRVRAVERLYELVTEIIERCGDRVKLDLQAQKIQIAEYTVEEMFELADDGDLEPLRALAEAKIPGIAPFIWPLKREPHMRRFTPDWKLDWAVEDVHYIRYELWKPVFGHYKRPNNPPTAIYIAANFWKVDEGWLESRVDNKKRKNAGPDR